jgi:hypothetical protein
MTELGFRKSRKMQKLSFQTVEEFLDYLPEDELKMVEQLRALIYQAIPDITEKLSYNVPFFKRNSNICFIWPPSIPWGTKTYPFVRLGFTKGYLISDEIGFLEKGERKQVYCKDFTSLEQMDETLILTYLTKVILIDQEA